MKQKQILLAGLTFLAPEVKEFAEITIKVTNVLMPKGIEPPKTGITFYYGSKVSTTKSLQLAFSHAAQNKKQLLTIPMEMHLAVQDGPSTTRLDLPGVELLNIERIDKEMTTMLYGHLVMFCEKNGIKITQEVGPLRVLLTEITNHLDFLDYLKEQPEFKHLVGIVYPVIEDTGNKSSRITLFDKSRLDLSEVQHPIYKNAKFTY